MTEPQPLESGLPVTGPLPPLKITRARWFNQKIKRKELDGRPYDDWAKVLAHKGVSYDTDFRYGTDTKSDRRRGDLQVAWILSPLSGVIGMDVDNEAEYLRYTRTAQYIRREHAISTRGDKRWHALIDARTVPPEWWPSQGPIFGGDVKSKGFIPQPGCMHWSGDLYLPVLHDRCKLHTVDPTPELMAAMLADRADYKEWYRELMRRLRLTDPESAAGRRSGGGDGGGGHDHDLYSAVLSMLRRGWAKEQIYAAWLTLAVPLDPARPYERGDFERHYASAVRFAAAEDARDLITYAEWQSRKAGAR